MKRLKSVQLVAFISHLFTGKRQELAKYSPVPVCNALSSLWHPTQILADLLTLHEHAHLFEPVPPETASSAGHGKRSAARHLPELRPLTVAYVGDSANVLHDMLVTYPRLGHQLRVASPEKYRAPKAVWDRVTELGCEKGIWWGSDPKEAVHNADVVITDTWYDDFFGHIFLPPLSRESGFPWVRKRRRRRDCGPSRVIR